MQPREQAGRLERTRPLATGAGEHFSGYGLMALAFESGYVLAFRRCAASSIGLPFTCLWQRHPDGGWVFHTNIDPARSCPRYFAPLLRDARVDDVELQWRAADELWVRARRARLHLALRLGGSAARRGGAAAARLLAGGEENDAAARSLGGRMAATLLGTGALTLGGRTPSGHRFRLRPTGVWSVRGAAAVLEGRDLGRVVAVPQPLALGGFALPARALLLMGTAVFTPASVAGSRSANGLSPAGARAAAGGRR